jgi:hypothetical protein
MGIYVQLLVRYLRLQEAQLRLSLAEDGIQYDSRARPVFVDS